MRTWRFALSLALVGCGGGQSPESPAPPSVVNVSVVDASVIDAGAGGAADAADVSSPEELERVVAASIALVDGYVARCGRSRLASLRVPEASLYADRDEITLRQRRPQGGWEGRDVAAWLREARTRESGLRRLATEPCAPEHDAGAGRVR